MACYFLGAFLLHQTHGARPRFPATRWVWTIGCDFYFWHVIAAFHFAHEWSHAAAAQSVNEHALAFTGQSAPYGIWHNFKRYSVSLGNFEKTFASDLLVPTLYQN